MMDKATTAIVSILTAIVGVAIVAVLVSRNANTAGVITSAGNAFGGILRVAVSPVTGGGGTVGASDASFTGNSDFSNAVSAFNTVASAAALFA